MTQAAVTSVQGQVWGAQGKRGVAPRTLPEETPVAITCNGTTQAVMMATPADLQDFAVGFATTEGYATFDQIEQVEIMPLKTGIEAQLWVKDAQAKALADRRRAMLGPVGCGLCGIDALDQAVRPLPRLNVALTLSWAEATAAPDVLRGAQPLHDATHAVHAAGFLRPGQGLIMAREDVGRHNALDKLIGALLRGGIAPSTGVFVLTSRVSIEMVQKTVMAQCPILIAVSAPTAHAVRMADDAGLTLAAFARGTRLELFSHPDRIVTQGENSDAA